MARVHMSRFECGHAGCREIGNYESSTRADQAKLYRQYGNGQWRCVRHSRPDEVLAPTNPRRVHELVCEEKFYGEKSIGLYWGGGSGFIYGPGFKAFARDFPAGTRLRISAEILPAENSEAVAVASSATCAGKEALDTPINPTKGGEKP